MLRHFTIMSTGLAALAVAGCAPRFATLEPTEVAVVATADVEAEETCDGTIGPGEFDAMEAVLADGPAPFAGYSNDRQIALDDFDCTRWRHHAAETFLRFDPAEIPDGTIVNATLNLAYHAPRPDRARVLQEEDCSFELRFADTDWTPGVRRVAPEELEARSAGLLSLPYPFVGDGPETASFEMTFPVGRWAAGGPNRGVVIAPAGSRLWRRVDEYCGIEIEAAELVVETRGGG